MLLARGAYVEKIWGGPRSKRGRPDLFICYRGRFIGIESKHPSKTRSAVAKATSKAQKTHIERIKSAGGVALSTNRIEDIEAVLAAIDLFG